MVNGQSDLLESGVPHESMKSDWYKDDKFGRGPSVFLGGIPCQFSGDLIVQQRITLASLLIRDALHHPTESNTCPGHITSIVAYRS